jgi:ComF family protein
MLKKFEINPFAFVHDIVNMVFPNLCVSCNRPLIKNENILCLHCKVTLPETVFHEDKENIMMKRFHGRIRIEHAAALYFFSKESHVQHLLHQLKYKEKPEIGVMLGRYYGRILKNTIGFKEADYIVPVPLHPKKEHKRGYNQSLMFAKGISETMEIPMSSKALIRKTYTGTQTRKSKEERWENVSQVFKAVQTRKLRGKHMLLVDDVVTTGSTLEACAMELFRIPDTKISLATIACVNVF